MQKTAHRGRGLRYGRLPAKLVRIMRMLSFLLLVCCLHVTASSSSQTVTFSGKEVPLKKLFATIEAQTGFLVWGRIDFMEKARPISLSVRNMPLKDVLSLALKDQPFTYEIADKTIILAEKEKEIPRLFLQQPPGTLKGQVYMSGNQPLAGATLSISGRSLGVTDQEGRFSVEASAGDLLVISYIGFEAKEIRVTDAMIGQGSTGIILLQRKETALQEVVVNTGYQSISRERSAGSFAKPDLDVVRKRSGTMNLLQRLEGLVPGLVLNNGTNSEYYPVAIRGLTSVNGATQPLYVVDGAPVRDLSQINPNDVEDITVLKDATAASIWGARAANGVIVVTTKRATGTKNKLKLDYDVFYSFRGKPDIDVFPRLNSKEYIETVQQLYNMPGYTAAGIADWATITAPDLNNGANYILPHEYLLYGQPTWMPAWYKDKTLGDLAAMDNISQMKDLWYRNSMLANHTVSVSANSEKYGIYASLGYTNDRSATPGEQDNTYLFNARQDFRFTPGLQVYLITNLNFNQTYSKRAIAPDGRFVPYASFTDEDGNSLDMSWLYRGDSLRNAYEQKSQGLADLGRLDLSYDPSRNFNSGYTKGDNLNSRLLAGVTLKIIKGLRFEGVYGGVLVNGRTQAYDAVTGYAGQYELARMTVAGPPVKSYVPTTGGTRSITNSQQRNWTVRNQLVYDNQWNDQQLTVLAGTEFQQQISSSSGSTVRGYDEYLLTSKSMDYTLTSAGIANAIINTNATFKINDLFNETYQDTRFRSYYANGAYTWRNYTLNASTRFDQSNLFGTEVSAQAKPVWSVGGSWLLSNEKFMDKASWIDRLSIRVTYGITGNSPAPGSGGSYDILGPGFAWGVPSGSVNAITINTPGNSRLSWEKTDNFNLGADFSVLEGRLSGSLDYYYKHTTNLLGDVPQNAFTGYTYVYGNAGVLSNRGVELSLTSVNIRKKDFSWSTQLTFAYNKGKMVTLYNSTNFQDASSLIRPLLPGFYNPTRIGLVEGYQPFTLFAYRYAGLDDTGDPQIYLADGTITKAPAAAKVSDLVDMGSTQPLATGGFINNFRYRNFNLNINMIYNFGFVLRRDVNELYTGRITARSFITGGIHSDFLQRWQQKGDEAITDIPAYDPVSNRAARTDLNYYTAADINVIKGDYVKLRDLTLSYDLPENIAGRIHAQGISLRVQLSNVMLWKANDYGIDPEFYSGVGTIVTSAVNASYVTGMRRIPVNQHAFTIGAHVTL